MLNHENDSIVHLKCQNEARFPCVCIVLVKIHVHVFLYIHFMKDSLTSWEELIATRLPYF